MFCKQKFRRVFREIMPTVLEIRMRDQLTDRTLFTRGGAEYDNSVSPPITSSRLPIRIHGSF